VTGLLALLLFGALIVIVVLTVVVFILAFVTRDQRHDNNDLHLEVARVKRDLRNETLKNLTLLRQDPDHGNPLDHLRRLIPQARLITSTPAECSCRGTCSYRPDSKDDCPPSCGFCASLSADADDLRKGKDQY
jgi:hypothetical protein